METEDLENVQLSLPCIYTSLQRLGQMQGLNGQILLAGLGRGWESKEKETRSGLLYM